MKKRNLAYLLIAKAMKHGSWTSKQTTIELFSSFSIKCEFDEKKIEMEYVSRVRGFNISSFKITKNNESVKLESDDMDFSFIQLFVTIKASFFAKRIKRRINRENYILEKEKEQNNLKRIFQ